MNKEKFEGEPVGKYTLSDEIKKFRKLVLKHRGPYCQRCHKLVRKYSELDMQHKDRDRWNNTAQNVVLLCRKCHTEVHSFSESEWLN